MGPKGTNSHQASIDYVEKFYGKDYAYDIEFVDSNPDIIKRVAKDYTKIGVVPFETSGGLIHDVVYALFENRTNGIKICGEVILPIRHVLAYKSDISKVKTIKSHPEGLDQCSYLLDSLFKGIAKERCDSTAKAAQIASEDETVAAICNPLAASLYNLKVHQTQNKNNHIGNIENNETRFLVVSNKDRERPTGKDKTTLIYLLEDVPGALYGSLEPFAKYNLNLTNHTSIPTKRKRGEYYQLLEVTAHRNNIQMESALEKLAQCAVPNTLYIFGSYPRWE